MTRHGQVIIGRKHMKLRSLEAGTGTSIFVPRKGDCGEELQRLVVSGDHEERVDNAISIIKNLVLTAWSRNSLGSPSSSSTEATVGGEHAGMARVMPH